MEGTIQLPGQGRARYLVRNDSEEFRKVEVAVPLEQAWEAGPEPREVG
jgi:hypothetical protein